MCEILLLFFSESMKIIPDKEHRYILNFICYFVNVFCHVLMTEAVPK
jgi:hypothetical protein